MTKHHRAAIIGAGLGGISAAIGLLEDGQDDFVILEQAAGVGGTWYHNRYPGAECDVMSHFYSFSFEPNHRWSRRYAGQAEILAYIEGVIEKYRVRPHIRLNSGVRQMRWDEVGSRWILLTDRGELGADFVIAAVGMFNEPAWPNIDGLDTFGGRVIHTARWPAGELLEDQRVAVIGSAATSVQLVPELARTARQVHVFQRTPVWVLPKDDRPYTEEEIAAFVADPSAVPALRGEIEARINRTMTFTDPEIARAALEAGQRNLEMVADPVLREKLRPFLPWGSRRPILSNLWYAAFNRSNVNLVTDPIQRIAPQGVATVDGTLHEVDAVVCATGFAVTRYLSVIDVIGRDGHRLAQDWEVEPQAYLGVMTAGYPNLVMMYGPNTNNGSILTMLEYQAAFAVRQLRWMTDNDIAWFDIRPDVVERFNTDLQAALDKVEVWQAKPDGYYRGASGRIVTQWPHTMLDYERGLRAIGPELFEIVTKTGRTSALPRR